MKQIQTERHSQNNWPRVLFRSASYEKRKTEKLSQIRRNQVDMTIKCIVRPLIESQIRKKKKRIFLDNGRNLNNICRFVNRVVVLLIS